MLTARPAVSEDSLNETKVIFVSFWRTRKRRQSNTQLHVHLSVKGNFHTSCCCHLVGPTVGSSKGARNEFKYHGGFLKFQNYKLAQIIVKIFASQFCNTSVTQMSKMQPRSPPRGSMSKLPPVLPDLSAEITAVYYRKL